MQDMNNINLTSKLSFLYEQIAKLKSHILFKVVNFYL